MPPPKSKHDQSSAGKNVRVVTRVRPLSSSEKARGCSHIIETIPAGETEFLEIGAEKRRFELDAAFPSESTQVDVYERSGAAEAVKLDLIKGFNTTILAYGQTGSGKTFTMGTAISPEGNANGNDLHESEGVIPRAVNDLFHISKTTPNSVKVEMAYMEIYNEEIRDLLSNDPNSGDLRVQDLPDGTVGVTNVTMKSVESPAEVGKWMEVASNKRVVASTAMNAVSSRSHAVCTLYVTITPGIVISNGEDDYASDDDVSEIKSIASENKSTVSNGTFSSREQIFAKLTLVDLAGSEKPKRTGATGARMKEGININKGLFVLGQVISALSDSSSKGSKNAKKHIPYRESKLTRLLQDSLGGNTRTIMIACVSPADDNIEESTNTLRYAERARCIQNNAKRNVVAMAMSPAEAAALREENQRLKLELKQALADKDAEIIKYATMSLSKLNCDEKKEGEVFSSVEEEDDVYSNDGKDITMLYEECRAHEITIKKQEGDLVVSKDKFSSLSEELDEWRNKFENVCAFAKNSGLDLTEDIIDGTEIPLFKKETADVCVIPQQKPTATVVEQPAIVEKNESTNKLTKERSVIVSDDEDLPIDLSSKSLPDEKERLFSAHSSLTASIEEKYICKASKTQSCFNFLRKSLQLAHDQAKEEELALTVERENLVSRTKETAPPKKESNQPNKNNPELERRVQNKLEERIQNKLEEKIKNIDEKISKWKENILEYSTMLKQCDDNREECEVILSEIVYDTRCRSTLQKKLKDLFATSRTEKEKDLKPNEGKQKNSEPEPIQTISKKEKKELSRWLESEIESSILLRESTERLSEQIVLKCEALCRRDYLEDDMENMKGDVNEALLEVAQEIKMRTKLIRSYDRTVTNLTQDANKKKYKNSLLFSDDFVNIEKWQSFTRPQTLVVLSAAFGQLVSSKMEQEKLINVIKRMASSV